MQTLSNLDLLEVYFDERRQWDYLWHRDTREARAAWLRRHDEVRAEFNRRGFYYPAIREDLQPAGLKQIEVK